MTILGVIDTETTGLDKESDEIVELAIARYRVNPQEFAFIDSISILFEVESNPAAGVNGIEPELTNCGVFLDNQARVAMVGCDYLVAHNAEFDKGFVLKMFPDIGTPWVCSQNDYEWQDGESQKLVNLCCGRNIVFTAAKHRALVDVLMLGELLRHRGYDAFLAAAEKSKMPEFVVEALVSFADKDKAKAEKFRWEPDTKKWVKTVKAKSIQEAKSVCALFDFKTKVTAKEK